MFSFGKTFAEKTLINKGKQYDAVSSEKAHYRAKLNHIWYYLSNLKYRRALTPEEEHILKLVREALL